MFKKGSGDWTQYRKLLFLIECNLHGRTNRARADDRNLVKISHEEKMNAVYNNALVTLRNAYEQGVHWVLFTHGTSTFGRGKTTAGSVVRQLMRSPEATPYLLRRECIEHEAVFVAAIRQKAQ